MRKYDVKDVRVIVRTHIDGTKSAEVYVIVDGEKVPWVELWKRDPEGTEDLWIRMGKNIWTIH